MTKSEAKLTYAKLVRQRYQLHVRLQEVGSKLTQREADRIERVVAKEIVEKT